MDRKKKIAFSTQQRDNKEKQALLCQPFTVYGLIRAQRPLQTLQKLPEMHHLRSTAPVFNVVWET